MRIVALLLLLSCLPAWAGDLIRLHNGRVLRGRIVSQDAESIVVDLGTGKVTVRRDAIRAIERGTTAGDPPRRVTQRDEWFLVLHRDKLVGWRRLVHTEGPRRVHVEERTVFFRPGGGDDVDIRRVEVADREGRPLEFLISETYGHDMDLVSGVVTDGKAKVRIRRNGVIEHRVVDDLPSGWRLALPAWSRFLESARPNETKTITALDVRKLRTVKLVLRREGDAALEDRRPCRRLSLVGDFRVSRAFYRPGEGALRELLNGETLVARRATRERVEMARRVHAAPEPLSVEDAVIYPFLKPSPNLTVNHVQAGVTLKAPDAGWLPRAEDRARGRVLTFEKVSIFASMEVFAYALPGADLDACVVNARARLRLTAKGLAAVGEPERVKLGGRPAVRFELRGGHRGERLDCVAAVVLARNRYLLLVGAAPERWWRWAKRDFDAFFGSLVVVD